jgi:membrane-bound lytic murein transglycosylase D
MFRLIFIFVTLLPINLVSNSFDFGDNFQKQAQILRKFDVQPAYINNPALYQVLNKYKRNKHIKYILRAMKNADVFLPSIKQILNRSSVPDEFLYLAITESSLDTVSMSNKSAGGIWQFIPSTARIYGLRVDRYVDERFDIIKSTEIAIKFLSTLYNRFGKWYLAAIAYNCGEGALENAINRAGSDELEVLINQSRSRLPTESIQYINKILALALLEANDETWDSEYSYLLNSIGSRSIATIRVGGGQRLEDIADSINLSSAEMQRLNGHIMNGITPIDGAKYNLYIPYDKVPDLESAYKTRRVYRGDMEQVVQQKTNNQNYDKLERVATRSIKRKSDNYSQLRQVNRIPSDRILTGTKVNVPIMYNGKSTSSNNRTKDIESELFGIRGGNNKYTIRKGDNLYSIAKKFDIDVKTLMKKNRLRSKELTVGDSLIVK